MPYPYTYPNYGTFAPAPSFAPQNFNPAPIQQPVAPQTPQGGVSAPSGYLCRPVTSRAEAEVFQIPFDGSTTYFVDTANGKIYSKTFNFADGTAPLVTYIRESDVPVPKYATIEDLNALREELKPKKAVKKDDE